MKPNRALSTLRSPGNVLSILALALMLTVVRQALAQDFSVESKTPPSVVGAGTFVSLEGKFTIALPEGMHGFRPLAFNTAAGRAAGDAYDWKMKEGSFIAGYVGKIGWGQAFDFAIRDLSRVSLSRRGIAKSQARAR